MIYINSNSGSINIPRHTFNYSQWYSLTLFSHLSEEVNLVVEGENISTNELYYKFAINDTANLNLETGEYTYKLKNSDDVVIENGLLTY